MMRTACIIHGKRKKALRLFKALQEHYPNWTFEQTAYSGHARELAHAFCEKGFERIVTVGGDGTIHEAVEGWHTWRKENETATSPVFQFFPAGSGNDLVRSLQTPDSVETFIQQEDQMQCFQMDVACVNSPSSETIFVNACDAGFGGEVISALEKAPTFFRAGLRYQWAVFRTFFSFKARLLEIQLDDTVLRKECLMVAIANGRYFGSGVGIAPDGSLDDGMLDVLVVGRVTIWQYLWFLPQLMRCQHIEHPEVSYHRVETIRIDGDANMECDGEKGPGLPVTITVLKRVLPVWCLHLY